MSSDSFKNVIHKMCLQIVYLIYMYLKDLALNDLQWLMYHKTKPNQTKPNQTKNLNLNKVFIKMTWFGIE